MKTYRWVLGIVAAALLLVGAAGSSFAWEREAQGAVNAQAAVGTAFTYQGTLTDGGNPANGDYDFQFTLYDAQSGGSQVGSTVTKNNVAVSDGTFTVKLDFGGVFDGTALWLEIGVRAGSSTGSYTTLSPRQELTPTPYAMGLVPGATIAGAVSNDGVLALENTAGDGVRVDSATDDGVEVVTAGGAGLQVRDAANHGVFVGEVGSPSESLNVIDKSAFEVQGSEQNGLSVGRADLFGAVVVEAGLDGFSVFTATDDGFEVSDAGGAGLQVRQATNHGVFVEEVGSPSSAPSIGRKSGFEVRGSEGNGLSVGRADHAGVEVITAPVGIDVVDSIYGLQTESATHGIHINQGTHGAVIQDQLGTGVSISDSGAGVRINNTDDDGVSVSGAGDIGVLVENSFWHGIRVDNAGVDGVVIFRPDDNGVWVNQADADGDGLGQAGYFGGDVEVTGNLSKGGGGFKIDHPQDPENQYLSHSFVESPERTNVYNGNVTTDRDGYATVQLPDYFESLNKDYTYQLTVVGTFAQAIIAEEIENNQFVIQTDEPNVKVSWQVTGVRQDAWAEANPMIAEQDKPAEERGTYIHPELYGQPESKSVESVYMEAREGNAQ